MNELVHTPSMLPRLWRLFSLLVLGFASGLPLGLTGQTLQAWLSTAGLATAAIGVFSLVGTPYIFKFIWAPLMDRFEPPFLGRRRGWLVLTQLLLAVLIYLMSHLNPVDDVLKFSIIAMGVAFLSSSQDVVIDAYRTDVAPVEERGLSASLGVLGYRFGMIVSGGVAFILADQMGWAQVYQWISFVMLGLAAFSVVTPAIPDDAVQPQRQRDFSRFIAMVAAACGGFYVTRLFLGQLLLPTPDDSTMLTPVVLGLVPLMVAQLLSHWVGVALKFEARKDVAGFIYMLFGVLVGYYLGEMLAKLLAPLATQMFVAMDLSATLVPKWVDLVEVVVILLLVIPCAYLGAKWSQFELLLKPLHSYFDRDAAMLFLGLIILYKLGDAFAGNLSTTFLLKGVQFSLTEVGLVNKLFGMFATIGGAVLGGLLMLRLGLYRSLLLFGVLQALSNLGFWALAEYGKDAWGHLTVPVGAFAQVVTNSKNLGADVVIDNLLMFVVSFENITSGMGTAAFVALLMALASGGYSLTHYALLSALASIGRIFVGPISGVLSETIGWSSFFLFATLMALPSLWLLWVMKKRVQALA